MNKNVYKKLKMSIFERFFKNVSPQKRVVSRKFKWTLTSTRVRILAERERQSYFKRVLYLLSIRL